MLDKVNDEVRKGNDELTNWIKKHEDKIKICNYKNQTVIANYQAVLQHVQSCGFYKKSALDAWVPQNIADPWLIAAAKTYGYILVTLEVRSGGLSNKTKSKAAKIPDVADALGVKTISLFEMMRKIGIAL